MNARLTIYIGAVALCSLVGLSPGPAFAQSVPLFQEGQVLLNDVAKYTRNGVARNPGGVDGDNNGAGVNPFAVTDYGQLGFCSNSAKGGAAAWSALCLGHDSSGAGILSLTNRGGGTATPLNVSPGSGLVVGNPTGGAKGAGTGNFAGLFVNGVQVATSITSGILGPNVSTVNALAAWNNTTGNLLKDTGLMPSGQNLVANMSGPTSWTNPGFFDGLRVNVNDFPQSAQFGGGTYLLPQAFVSALNVPAEASNGVGAAGFAIAGYGRSSSTGMGSVGVFGGSTPVLAGVDAWGGNFMANNCAGTINCVSGAGTTNNDLWGIEIDANIFKAPGGVAPDNVKLSGLNILGGSDTQVGAGGYSYAILVGPLGIFMSPQVPWQRAFMTNDGAAEAALYIGAAVGSPAANTPGQVSHFAYYDALGAFRTIQLAAESNGNLAVSSYFPGVFTGLDIFNNLSNTTDTGTRLSLTVVSGTAALTQALTSPGNASLTIQQFGTGGIGIIPGSGGLFLTGIGSTPGGKGYVCIDVDTGRLYGTSTTC